MNRRITTLFAAALLAATAPLLASCTATPSVDASSVESGDPIEAGLTLSDGWAKSAESGGMTGVFGMLANDGSEDLVITGVESDTAGMIELHEVTAEGVMQEIEGEVVVPAGGTFELAPGANHIMLMQLTRDLLAGDEVTFTVHYASDSGAGSAEFTVLVKDFAGANEEYGDDHGAEHDGHDAESHDHGEEHQH